MNKHVVHDIKTPYPIKITDPKTTFYHGLRKLKFNYKFTNSPI